ncbi:MAG: hypothetical protein IKI84_02335 [Clostridia bacterium]|nr:hypothetical protein [Clostridia bacterium]
MKLKILRENAADNRITGAVEEILSETCSAFGHRLNVGYGLIGKGSRDRYGVPLTQEVIDGCAEYDGTLALTGDEELQGEISDAMNIPVLILDHARDISPDGKHTARSVIAVVQSIDEVTVDEAARAVRNFALIKGIGFAAVRALGKKESVWKNAFLSASLLNGDNRLSEMTAPQAIRKMIREPEDYGMIVLPPSFGPVFSAAAEELAHSCLPVRKMYGVSGGVYFCKSSENAGTQIGEMLSAVLSSADFLEFSCHLFREAACVRTGVYNVTRGAGDGMNLPSDPVEAVVDRICSQISLAGHLIGGA